jgi:monoamine oxidase
MGAMGAWDLMGQPSGDRPLLKGRRPDTKVIVLGAGISGLTVGYELGKLDYDYRVLEARDTVGGLCWTVRRGATHTEIGGETQVCDFDEGQYFNAGAWRIPNRDKGVLGYCKELGVPLEIFELLLRRRLGARANVRPTGAPARGQGGPVGIHDGAVG